MRFDDLDLLLGLIEIHVVLYILVHAFKDLCCNVTSSCTMCVTSHP
jgi:hypothetical protein